MKTLDEVIEAIGFCKSGNLSKCKDCPYIGTCELDYAVLSDDVLHYLREYRDKHEEMLQMEEALGYCEMSENRPLTWDELRTMEGKPVWVEIWEATDSDFVQYRWGNGAWYIVKDFVSGALAEYCQLTPNRRTWIKQSYGEEWQAYRKERE